MCFFSKISFSIRCNAIDNGNGENVKEEKTQ